MTVTVVVPVVVVVSVIRDVCATAPAANTPNASKAPAHRTTKVRLIALLLRLGSRSLRG